MAQMQPIEAVSFALGGTSMCVAAKRELWAKPIEGDAFAVHSIVDENGPYLPWYEVYVTDYRGKRYDFCSLSHDSQEELCTFVCVQVFDTGEA